MSDKKPKSSKHENDANPDFKLAGIGNYTFSKTLGQGNFAQVKLAKHKLTGLEAAIKIIDKTQLDEKKLAKLHREVRIMKLLHHPNTVKLYEVIETKHTLFLVLEYINGGELYDYLVAHGRMKEKDARAKFRQILNAVSYCHRKHVIHRDLKAENLLLNENFDIKVADFGFSNWFEFEGQLDTFCGSPPYAAPELFQGRKYVGPEVDVWSLGVILYVLCTGCLPFDGKDLKEMREVVCRGRYKIPFYLSDPCEKLLRKFLVRDPTKRATLDHVADDAWLNEGYETSCLWQADDIDVKEDDEIIKVMEAKFGITRDQTLKSLREDVYDDVGAIYHLFYHEKYAKTGSVPIVAEVTKAVEAVADTTDNNKPRLRVPTVAGDQSESAQPKSDEPQTRERSMTVDSHARRPVTWVGGDTDVKKYIADQQTTAKSIGPAATNAVITAEASVDKTLSLNRKPLAEVQAPEEAHTQNRRASMLGVLGIRKEAAAPATAIASVASSEKPRSLRFTFNSNTTSTRPPDTLVTDVIAACKQLEIRAGQLSRYVVECNWKEGTKDACKVEVEICELPRLKNLHGLKFKRTSGPSNEYKDLCSKLLGALQL